MAERVRPALVRGVYILGNDGVAGFLEALLTSLRRHSPDLPARLIPYDSNLAATRRLCTRYNVVIHEDTTFPELEEISRCLWADSPHRNFRRLSAFWGPFENFLYLDADICVLDRLEPLFDVFEQSGHEFASFDNDHERVYLTGLLRDRMIHEHGSVGFNAGHFFSRKGVFALGTFRAAARAAQPWVGQFQDRADQGFLNFAIDHFRKDQARLPVLVNDLADKQWASQPVRRVAGTWRLNKPGNESHGKRLVLIHWSGCHHAGWHLPNRSIFYRHLLADRPVFDHVAVPFRDFAEYYMAPFRSRFNAFRVTAGRWRRVFLPFLSS